MIRNLVGGKSSFFFFQDIWTAELTSLYVSLYHLARLTETTSSTRSEPECDCCFHTYPNQPHRDGNTQVWFNWTKQGRCERGLTIQPQAWTGHSKLTPICPWDLNGDGRYVASAMVWLIWLGHKTFGRNIWPQCQDPSVFYWKHIGLMESTRKSLPLGCHNCQKVFNDRFLEVTSATDSRGGHSLLTPCRNCATQ